MVFGPPILGPPQNWDRDQTHFIFISTSTVSFCNPRKRRKNEKNGPIKNTGEGTRFLKKNTCFERGPEDPKGSQKRQNRP